MNTQAIRAKRSRYGRFLCGGAATALLVAGAAMIGVVPASAAGGLTFSAISPTSVVIGQAMSFTVSGATASGDSVTLTSSCGLGGTDQATANGSEVATFTNVTFTSVGTGSCTIDAADSNGSETGTSATETVTAFGAAHNLKFTTQPSATAQAATAITFKVSTVGKTTAAADAETSPVSNPEYYQYDFKLDDVAEVWRHGSVISSWLVDLTADALTASPDLDQYSGHVSDSGEGRWTVEAAINESVPAPVIAASLWQRFESRGEGEFTAKVLSAMRAGFGGHVERSS